MEKLFAEMTQRIISRLEAIDCADAVIGTSKEKEVALVLMEVEKQVRLDMLKEILTIHEANKTIPIETIIGTRIEYYS